LMYLHDDKSDQSFVSQGQIWKDVSVYQRANQFRKQLYIKPKLPVASCN
jgi:hypothetical protein